MNKREKLSPQARSFNENGSRPIESVEGPFGSLQEIFSSSMKSIKDTVTEMPNLRGIPTCKC